MNRLFLFGAAAGLLVGCGVTDVDSSIGPCGWKVAGDTPEVRFDAEYFDQLAFEAINALDEGGLVDKTTFCEDYGGFEVVIRKAWKWRLGEESVIGTYWSFGPNRYINLGCDGTALAHELLHHKDVLEKRFRTSEHYQWKEMGFYDATGPFEIAAVARLGFLIPGCVPFTGDNNE